MLKVGKDPLFWLLADINHTCAEPLVHHQHFLQSDVDPAEGNLLSLLVCGKAQSIFREFDAILTGNHCDKVLDSCPMSIVDPLREMIINLCLHYASGYYRRVVLPTTRPDWT